jgi:hypothetical protein
MLRCVVVALLLMAGVCLEAQDSSGTLRGRVTDPSGAVIPQATVTATSDKGTKTTATTNNQGIYEIKGLASGTYSVSAVAKGFAIYTESNVTVTAGQAQQFDLALGIDVPQEKINVEEQPATVSVAPTENASAIIIKGKDLDALSDDPDELQSELEALAGPSAGPSGGQIYIDGFTAGQLPPKSAIREIRVNQDPFSAQYDKLGYGRIEIFTKPGTDQFHGQVLVNGNDSAFNSTNPFVTEEPPYHSEFVNGNVSGPISKKASFFFDGTRRDISDASIVNATILDPENQPAPFVQAFPTNRTRTELSPRLDFQLSKNNTLTVRYQYYLDNENNQGIGQFSLPSQSYNSSSTEHTVQVSDTQVLSTNVVNETRFQFIRELDSQNVQSFAPTISVLGAFTGGGNSQGNSNDAQNHYELQNYTSVVHHNHFIKFGGRLRASTDSNTSVSGFNGTFTFSSLLAYQNQLNGLCPSGPTMDCGPSQFYIISGQPLSEVTYVDVGLYGSDDWKIRPNMTLSYGLRYETQNNIGDHGDVAPRISFAWGLGGGQKSAPKTVLRTGFGIFYDRVGSNLVLQSERLNGVTQLQTTVANPDFFPNIPTGSVPGGQTSPTVYQFASNIRAPYTLQSAVSLERQITKKITASLTYLNSIGEHQLFLRNANAPLPDGSRPFGGSTNIYQYDSEGIFRQNQLIANFRVNMSKVSLFGFYTLSYANSDLGTSASSGGGASFFPGGGGSAAPNFLTHQYDPMEDYGRASFDVRNRVFLGGTVTLPYAFHLSPFIVISSGTPFNITVGQDLNGDSIFNDRPSLASAATCPVKTLTSPNTVCTPYGTFNTAPGNAQAIPINTETGPTLASVNLRLSRTFGFGKEIKGGGSAGAMGGGPGGRGGGGPGGGLGGRGLTGGGGGPFSMGATTNRRYNLTLSVSARNVLNRVNLATPVGNLDSPVFGQSTGLAGAPYSSGSASRRIDLQAMFSF